MALARLAFPGRRDKTVEKNAAVMLMSFPPPAEASLNTKKDQKSGSVGLFWLRTQTVELGDGRAVMETNC
jgi:hypothetical protein